MSLLHFYLRALFLTISCLFALAASAQSPSRSGLPAPPEDKSALRLFPCGGLTLLDEKFQGDSLPAGWQVYDEDGLTPAPQLQFLTATGGWQSIIDPKDTTSNNRVFASPAWYADTAGVSDDWLVLPAQADLPQNVCLSWYAYSQDLAFQESYEIMVSTTGGTAADLAAGDTIFSEDAEQKDFTFRSVDLSAYAGQDVWIGFHHSSVDKFLLVVDDIRLAEVEQIDLSMFLLDPISAPKNTDITISGALINRGLTEIEFDSAELQISYRIDNGEVKTYGFPSDETIAPNDTLQFSHDSTWTPTDDAVYLIEFWIDSLAGDGNVENDTLKKWQGIGAKTAVTERMIPGLSVWYNQAGSSIMLNELPGVGYTWELRDIQGRILSPTQGLATTHMQVPSLKPGIYFWVLSGQAGIEHVQKISILR